LKNEIPARKCGDRARANLPRTFDFSALMALYMRSQCCVYDIATARFTRPPHMLLAMRRISKKREGGKENLANRSAREIANFYCQLSAERA
jgi:hypothetical protein